MKFKFVCDFDKEEDSVHKPKIIFTFEASNLDDVLEQFEYFLRGCSFTIRTIEHTHKPLD